MREPGTETDDVNAAASEAAVAKPASAQIRTFALLARPACAALLAANPDAKITSGVHALVVAESVAMMRP
jgi:hypothetical protein